MEITKNNRVESMEKRYDVKDDDNVYIENVSLDIAETILALCCNEEVDAYLTESQPVEAMLCDKKYVITETERLINPAGHHPDDRVFKQTKIAIHCDEIPKALPKCNLPLYAHEIEKIIKQ